MNLFDVYPLFDLCPVRGKDVYVYDDQDQAYLDLYGGHAVISIGHAHPKYVNAISNQVQKLGFYSNSVVNPLQQELANKLEKASGCADYALFLCNSGAEANENALKVASFHTGKSRILYFDHAFHGRTSGVVSVTDNESIKAPFNQNHNVTKLPFGDAEALKKILEKEDVAGVIFEVIQGVGGLDESETEFYKQAEQLCQKHGALLIADEVQSGYGRTGDFFGFQKHGIQPDLISMAKGMGNGFPIGGVLISDKITPKKGMLGTTFGGNHLACAAGIAVLDTIEEEKLSENALKSFDYFKNEAEKIPQVKKVKGRGLMLGLEFDFEVAAMRKKLLFEHRVFTGAAANKKLLRILPPLTIKPKHLDVFFTALKEVLEREV